MKFMVATAFLATSFATITFAQTKGLSIREACRRAVSGHYLSLADKLQRKEAFIGLLSKHRDQLSQRQGTHRKLYEKLKKQADGDEFEISIARRRDSVQHSLRAITLQLDEKQTLLKQAKKDLATIRRDFTDFTAATKPVFKLVHRTNIAEERVPDSLQYIYACRRYRMTCPLPLEQAFNLMKISLDDGLDRPCKRYASYSGAERPKAP